MFTKAAKGFLSTSSLFGGGRSTEPTCFSLPLRCVIWVFPHNSEGVDEIQRESCFRLTRSGGGGEADNTHTRKQITLSKRRDEIVSLDIIWLFG